MADNELSIPEPEKNLQQQFNNDTALVAENTEVFVREVYPYLLPLDSKFSNTPIERDSTALIESIKFFKIETCTVEETDSVFEYLNTRITKFLSVAYSMNVPVCYGIIGQGGKTSILLGIDPAAETAENADSIKKIIQGLMPDISISGYSYKEAGKTKFGLVGGAPSYIIDGKPQSFDYSSLVRALNGRNYCLLVMAKPVNTIGIQKKIGALTELKDSCLAISKRNISLQQSLAHTEGEYKTNTKTHSINAYAGVMIGPVVFGGGYGYSWGESISKSISETITNGKSLGLEIQNGFALDLAKRAENAVTRLQKGLSAGFWQTAVSFSTDDDISMKTLRGCLYSEMAKSDPLALPPRLIDFNSITGGKQSLVIPKDMFDTNNSAVSSPLCSFANTEELSLLFSLPDKNVPGYELKTGIRYPVSPRFLPSKENAGVELGNVCDGGNELENLPFSLSFDDLNKHTFVCGITGSGKTNSVKHILSAAKKPFWVIECAKKEYRKLDFTVDKDKKPVIFTLGRPEINCLSFNPFYIMQGISPQMHIDYLKDIFNASFSFYGPMPYIFEKCLHNVYLKRGWNLNMGYHPWLANTKSMAHLFDSEYIARRYARGEHKYIFPTMYDLKNEIEDYVTALGYEGELSANIKTAILARLESLCVGAKGFMLNTSEAPDFTSLLRQNAVFELEGLADDADKAFSVGLLIIYLTEYRMYEKEISHDYQPDLKHLLVIEEAHRLLKNVSTEKTSEELGNPKGKAIEHFTNMIAEMRSYGQGVIISEQIPSKIAPDVIKNSSNKIIHRIVARDDQEIIANMIGIGGKDTIYLGDQIKGRALCHTEGMRLPFSVAFPKVPEIDTKDSDLRRQTIKDEQQDFSILKSLMLPCLLQVDEKIPRLINTFFTFNDNCIKTAVRKIKKEAYAEVKLNNPRLLKEARYDEVAAAIISELCIKYLLSGIYYTEKLPESVFEIIRKAVMNPYDEPIRNLAAAFFEIDNKNETVVHAVTELALNYFYKHREKKIDMHKLVASYFIETNEAVIEKIIGRINERTGESHGN